MGSEINPFQSVGESGTLEDINVQSNVRVWVQGDQEPSGCGVERDKGCE